MAQQQGQYPSLAQHQPYLPPQQQQQSYYPPPHPIHLPHPISYPHHHHQYPPYHHPLPHLPPYHYEPPHPHVPPSYSERPSAKRQREAAPVGDGDGDGPATKRRTLRQDVVFRVVVPSRQIGKVIGKGGYRIQRIRDETRATIKIADAIARYEERVIIICSRENEGGLTDAEKALYQIAALILMDDGTGSAVETLDTGAAGGVSAGHVASTAIRLLIAGSQTGSLIGVSGQNIEKLRESSGATITILIANQLPLSISAHESDRLVQISGEVPAVLKAVEEIGAQLRENPPKEFISVTPTYNLNIARTDQQYVDPNAADYVTLDMLISETMVGGFIGICGSNISRIRNESGAMIKVFGAKGERKHRQIQLGGTAQQVALAKQRIDEFIYSQWTQQPADE